jgi:hypothetical protein
LLVAPEEQSAWSIESAGQELDWAITAGSEISPENTLKEETLFVRFLLAR